MKLLLSILGTLTIGGSSAIIFTNSTNNLVSTNQTLSYEEPTKTSNLSNSSKIIEEYVKNNQDSILKEDVLNSLYFENQELKINFLTLEKYQSDNNLYSILTGKEFQNNLLDSYNNGFLVYNQETQKFSFVENKLSNFSKETWFEYHWYWFGWMKSHLTHTDCQNLANYFSMVSNIGEAAEGVATIFPPGAIAIAAATIYFIATSYIFSTVDQGNGMWMGFLWGLPDFGWGAE